MNHLDDFQKAAIVVALKKLFAAKYFDICTLDKAVELARVIPNKKDYAALSMLHCCDYSDMPESMRVELFARVKAIFENTGFDIESLDDMMPESMTSKVALGARKVLSLFGRRQ